MTTQPQPRDITGIDRIRTKRMIRWRNPIFGSSVAEIREANGLIPMLNRVLILPYQVAPATQGQIVLAASTQREEQFATEYAVVIAMGSECYKRDKIAPPIAPGDHIMVTKYNGELTYGATGLCFRAIVDQAVNFRLDPGAWRHINDCEEFFELPEPGFSAPAF